MKVSYSNNIINSYLSNTNKSPKFKNTLNKDVFVKSCSFKGNKCDVNNIDEKSFSEFEKWCNNTNFLEQVEDYSNDLYINKKMKTDEEISKQALGYAAAALEQTEEWNNDNLFAVLKHVAEEKGLKNGQIMYPVRIALSGKETTPGGATELAVILGKTETLKRLHQAQQKLS